MEDEKDTKVQLPDGTVVSAEEAHQMLDADQITASIPDPPAEPAPSGDYEGDAPIETDAPGAKTVPLAALQAERSRRKGAEEVAKRAEARTLELEDMRRRSVADYRSEGPNWSEFTSFEEAGTAIENYVTQELTVMRAGMSADFAKLKYDDYDQVMKNSKVLDDLRTDSVLAEYVSRQPNPAEAAYEIGLGRLGPGEKPLDVKPNVDVKRVIENAEAPVTLSDAPAGPTKVSSAELDLAKAADLSEDEWAQLDEKTRARLLAGG